MRPLRMPLAVLAFTAALAAPVRGQDDASELLRQSREGAQAAPAVRAAPAQPVAQNRCMQGLNIRNEGKFCENVADCRAFCSCACTFDSTRWRPVRFDGSTTCPDMPRTGPGMLSREETIALGQFRHLNHRNERATQATSDALTRLDEWLENSAERRRLNARVRIGSCWRSAYEDSVDECGYVLKAQHMLRKPDLTDAQRATWEFKSNPQNLGLAWPGNTPHSGGFACDLVLQDAAGRDCFDSRAGVEDRDNPVPSCAIAARDASRLLDEAVTAAGGRRLNYEAWHYEWTDNTSSRCQHPDCADNHWPISGRPR
jgi:hypothetical protein